MKITRFLDYITTFTQFVFKLYYNCFYCSTFKIEVKIRETLQTNPVMPVVRIFLDFPSFPFLPW